MVYFMYSSGFPEERITGNRMDLEKYFLKFEEKKRKDYPRSLKKDHRINFSSEKAMIIFNHIFKDRLDWSNERILTLFKKLDAPCDTKDPLWVDDGEIFGFDLIIQSTINNKQIALEFTYAKRQTIILSAYDGKSLLWFNHNEFVNFNRYDKREEALIGTFKLFQDSNSNRKK